MGFPPSSFSIFCSFTLSYLDSHLSFFAMFALFCSLALYLPVSHMHTLSHSVICARCHSLKHFSVWSHPSVCFCPPFWLPSSICYHFYSFLHSSLPVLLSLSLCVLGSLSLPVLSLQPSFFSSFSSVIVRKWYRGTPGQPVFPLPVALVFISLCVSPFKTRV